MDRREIDNPKIVFKSPLIIYKFSSITAKKYALLIFKYLLKKTQILKIFIESQCFNSFNLLTNSEDVVKLSVFTIESEVDLCIIIGGDGTVLYTNHCFKHKYRPPFITFNLGTLGYMTYYNCEMYMKVLDEMLNNNNNSIFLEKRSTLNCKFISEKEEDDFEKEDIIALNEIVIERGESTNVINLDIFINDQPLTVVKGDGILISTSTGSTAYALSTGGIICHYSVDCMFLNAISPHSLSFRQISFPRDITIKVMLCSDSQKCSVSADGIKLQTRCHKQGVKISLSDIYVNIIILQKFISFPLNVWKEKLVDQLGWNNSFKSLKK